MAQAAECRSGEQLAGVVKQLDLGVATLVTVKEGCLADDVVEILDAVDLTIACETVDCPLPPLVARGSTLTVSGGQLDAATIVLPSDAYGAGAALFWEAAAIYVENGKLKLDDVDVSGLGSGEAGVFGVDSGVEVVDGEMKGLAGAGISALAFHRAIDVVVDGTAFEGIATVGVEANASFASAGAGVSRFAVENANFTAMETALGDISGVVEKFEHTGTTHYKSRSRGKGVVEVRAESTTVTDATFFDTSSAASATLWVTEGASVLISGGRFAPTESSTYALKIYDVPDTQIEGGVWEPQQPLVILSDTVSISSARFRLPASATSQAMLMTEGAELAFNSNSVCAEGVLSGVTSGLFVLQGSAAGFYGNVFQNITLPKGALFSAGEGTRTTSDLRFSDNTFVTVLATALVTGDVGEFGFVNNLVYQSTPRVEPTGAPTALTVGYNLWYAPALDALLPDAWPEGDLFDAVPTFVDGYSPGCPEVPAEGEEEAIGPAPAADSPVVDAGSEDVAESPDGTRSDIGAIDFDHGTDTGGTDTGGTDSGDTGDDEDSGSDPAPDCVDGEANCIDGATVQYGGGCAFGGFGAAAAPLLALWRRRRPRGAMRG